MNDNVYLYSVNAGTPPQLALDHLAAIPVAGLFKGSYTAFAVLTFGDATYVAGYAKADGNLDFYRFSEGAPWLDYAAGTTVGAGWDQIDFLSLANTPYALLYRSDNGNFVFVSVTERLDAGSRYAYSRRHAPAATKGFSMVKPFVLGGGIVIMAYSYDSGAMCMYGLSAVASSPSGVAPLLVRVLEDFTWAKGWTRFAFFQLGAGNFFLKTNVLYPNVNIDHVRDDPATGTSEIATNMDLPDAMQLQIVAPFKRDNGDPHFLAYRGDGATNLYRIHSDCQGWTKLGATNLPVAATTILFPSTTAGQRCLVI
jgi:hypothetical protein